MPVLHCATLEALPSCRPQYSSHTVRQRFFAPHLMTPGTGNHTIMDYTRVQKGFRMRKRVLEKELEDWI